MKRNILMPIGIMAVTAVATVLVYQDEILDTLFWDDPWEEVPTHQDVLAEPLKENFEELSYEILPVSPAVSFDEDREEGTKGDDSTADVVDEDHILFLEQSRPVDFAPLLSGYIAARIAEREGNVSEAATFYEQAEQADPQNYWLKEKAFTLQLKVGNIAEAVDLATELKNKQDVMPIVFVALLVDAVEKDDLNSAAGYAKRLVERAPDIFQFQLLQAYVAQAQGKPMNDVLALFDTDLTVGDSLSYRDYHKARLLEAYGQTEGVEDLFRNAFLRDKTSVLNFLAYVAYLERTNQALKMPQVVDAFVKANPESIMALSVKDYAQKGSANNTQHLTLKGHIADVLFGFSTIIVAKEATDPAYQLLNLSHHLVPDNAFAQFYKGILLEQEGRYDDALVEYQQVLADDYLSNAAQLRIVEVLSKLDRKKEALKQLDKIIKKYNFTQLLHLKAALLYDMEQFDEAIKLYTIFIEKTEEPKATDAWLYFARGTAYEQLKRFDAAGVDLSKSVALSPNNPIYMNYLGYMWVEQEKNMDEAFELIAKAMIIRPEDGAIADSMGWYWYKKGEYDKAVDFLEHALQLEPSDPTIHRHLGDAYEKSGDIQSAILHWERALLFKPKDAEERQYLQNRLSEMADVE